MFVLWMVVKISMVVLVVILVVFKEIKGVVISGTTVSSNCASEIASILLVPLLAVILQTMLILVLEQ